jgi:hypothetical protein
MVYLHYRNKSPQLNVESLILEHSGPDYDIPDDKPEADPVRDIADTKRARAINIAKGRRALEEKRIEKMRVSEKMQRFTYLNRAKRSR